MTVSTIIVEKAFYTPLNVDIMILGCDEMPV